MKDHCSPPFPARWHLSNHRQSDPTPPNNHEFLEDSDTPTHDSSPTFTISSGPGQPSSETTHPLPPPRVDHTVENAADIYSKLFHGPRNIRRTPTTRKFVPVTLFSLFWQRYAAGLPGRDALRLFI
ncbi:hypothetical protein HPP92_021079 [Vanilla planifolia]|uniref:Uncharacterized protein n=1 Tax=Vanilla planifolia TaxID=51239 RepID=A0A835Q4W4_VANPL|nr:hypothetical protein HPP92_021079 [Vanilla planifolia]